MTVTPRKPTLITQLFPKRSPQRRIGCGVLLVIWFVILLTPCFLITLASQNEILITFSDVPGHQARIWLVMEADQRGVGLSSPSLFTPNADTRCVQTDTRFLLWAGRANPSVYCACEQRTSAAAPWLAADSDMQPCNSLVNETD